MSTFVVFPCSLTLFSQQKFIEAFKGKNCKRKIISRLDNKLKMKIGNTELTQGIADLVKTTVEYF